MHDLELSPAAFVAKAKREQISPERERVLLLAYRTQGDMQARDELAAGTRWLPATLAKERAYGFDVPSHFHDLYMEGQVALLLAMDRFDLGHETRFSSYAYNSCKGAMRDYLRDSALSIVADPEKVTDGDGSRVRIKLRYRGDVSLDEPVRPDSDEDRLSLWPAEGITDPADIVAHRQQVNRLCKAFSRLNDRQELVLRECVLGDKGLSDLREVLGGISSERIRQIGASAISTLHRVIHGSQPEPEGKPGKRRSVVRQPHAPRPAVAG